MAHLKVTLVYEVGAVRQNYNRQTLDGLLGNAVCREAMRGMDLPTVADCYDVPLPLRCLWRNEHGWPLWAASYFWPEGEMARGNVVFHKRAIMGHWSAGRGKDKKLTLNKAAGPHKEKRVPVPVEASATGRYVAYCVGDADAIAELLEHFKMVSGRRNVGLGTVKRFEIEPVGERNVLIHGDVLSRAVPEGAVGLLSPHAPAESPWPAVGWTPPQWKQTLFGAGWPAGSALEIDFYEAA
ncbi:MAG: hypothetical protein KKC55_14320 [Gammaproteobacteria bacterium]|nr:hypothetical protein [Gammaproteobacteria bacterium]